MFTTFSLTATVAITGKKSFKTLMKDSFKMAQKRVLKWPKHKVSKWPNNEA